MTAIVAFTFGSLRDIISLIQIANTIRTALYDTKSTSAEYRDLLAELDSLVYTIASVQHTLSVHGPDRLSQSVENGLYHAVHVCMGLLTQANEQVAALRSSTTSSLWRRVGWMLVRKDECVALRLRLSEQIKAMNTLLTLAQGDQLESVQAVAREQHALVIEIHRCVKNLPQRLGYLWEGDPDAETLPVKLKFTNRPVITLPWELCESEEHFGEFLEFYTRSRCRQLENIRVLHGTYVLTSDEGDDEGIVFPDEVPDGYYDEERLPGSHALVQIYDKILSGIWTSWIPKPWDVRPGITVKFDSLYHFVKLPKSKRPMLLDLPPIISLRPTTIFPKTELPRPGAIPCIPYICTICCRRPLDKCIS